MDQKAKSTTYGEKIHYGTNHPSKTFSSKTQPPRPSCAWCNPSKPHKNKLSIVFMKTESLCSECKLLQLRMRHPYDMAARAHFASKKDFSRPTEVFPRDLLTPNPQKVQPLHILYGKSKVTEATMQEKHALDSKLYPSNTQARFKAGYEATQPPTQYKGGDKPTLYSDTHIFTQPPPPSYTSQYKPASHRQAPALRLTRPSKLGSTFSDTSSAVSSTTSSSSTPSRRDPRAGHRF